mmetsp:Transcript_31773/g.69442  ORF Transcript_31773/g.69442 Transcript_31773/m.69442 type:complete len:232 (-) Transcript_31773:81-776(-)
MSTYCSSSPSRSTARSGAGRAAPADTTAWTAGPRAWRTPPRHTTPNRPPQATQLQTAPPPPACDLSSIHGRTCIVRCSSCQLAIQSGVACPCPCPFLGPLHTLLAAGGGSIGMPLAQSRTPDCPPQWLYRHLPVPIRAGNAPTSSQVFSHARMQHCRARVSHDCGRPCIHNSSWKEGEGGNLLKLPDEGNKTLTFDHLVGFASRSPLRGGTEICIPSDVLQKILTIVGGKQ